MKLESGQVWRNVKHSPLKSPIGILPSAERFDVILIKPWHTEVSDPLWVVEVAKSDGFMYFELESVIRTGEFAT